MFFLVPSSALAAGLVSMPNLYMSVLSINMKKNRRKKKLNFIFFLQVVLKILLLAVKDGSLDKGQF